MPYAKGVYLAAMFTFIVRYEPNEFWMLAIYAKAKRDDVPAHILKQLLEAFRNG